MTIDGFYKNVDMNKSVFENVNEEYIRLPRVSYFYV